MSNPVLEIVEAGLQSSVQDLGRKAFGHWGISESGALDSWTLQICNALVGNPLDTASIELSGHRIHLRSIRACLVAIGSYSATVRLNGKRLSDNQALWTALPLAEGDELILQTEKWSTRHYLAISGGFKTVKALDSAATDLVAGLGTPLTKGTVLQSASKDAASQLKPTLPFRQIAQPLSLNATLRCIPGPEYHHLSEQQKNLWEKNWLLSDQSNRMGYRLMPKGNKANGSTVFQHDFDAENLRSHAVFPGVVQMPPGGQAIILLADCGATGGYARIAKVIDADLWKLAHIPFGESVRLKPTGRPDAIRELKKNSEHVHRIAIAARQSLTR